LYSVRNQSTLLEYLQVTLRERGEMKNRRVYLLAIFGFALLINTTACSQTPATSAPTIAPTPTTAPIATAGPTMEPGDSTRKLTVDGLERSYLLHIPPGLDSSQPVPILFVFHPQGGTTLETEIFTGLVEIADQANFLIVYPEGIGLSWNVGSCCGEAADKKVNDSAFVRQILSDLGTLVSADPKRIYATGLANGALFTYKLACEMSDVFAGIAPVAGILVTSPCQPKQPVSVLHVHGLADNTIPYSGGGILDTPPVEQVIDTWVKLDGCTGAVQVDHPIEIVTHSVYSSCQSGTAVELYAIDKGGDDWPSKYVLSISQIMWDFFAAHPKQS
jgi:polyhydroxybutyrate depolymerase